MNTYGKPGSKESPVLYSPITKNSSILSRLVGESGSPKRIQTASILIFTFLCGGAAGLCAFLNSVNPIAP